MVLITKELLREAKIRNACSEELDQYSPGDDVLSLSNSAAFWVSENMSEFTQEIVCDLLKENELEIQGLPQLELIVGSGYGDGDGSGED